jgi:hypothetical protein
MSLSKLSKIPLVSSAVLIESLKREVYLVGSVYPGSKWVNVGAGVGGLEVRKGGVASWMDERNEGVFLSRGVIREGEVIGIYGGKVVECEGLYVLEMVQANGRKLRVEGS